jgi:hypothetical protein
MANGYQGGGQPSLRSGWLDGWSKTPTYRGTPCSGNGPGGHHGHPHRRSAGTFASTATPAYRYPPASCPVVVQEIPAGTTAVQTVATSAEAETLAKQGQIAIVFPRST